MEMMSCDYDTYERLKDKCDPEYWFKWIREDLISSIREYDEETAEEVESWVDCTSSFLNRYMKFAAGCMRDDELYKFYNDVLKLIDNGIKSREWQKSLVDEQVTEAEEYYWDEVITEDEFEDIKRAAEDVKAALDADIELLEELKEFCVKARDRTDVVVCIEKVASMSHSRGSMLPVMCGAYLPEDIVEAETGWEREYEYTRPEDVGFWLSKDVPNVLECIKEFK